MIRLTICAVGRLRKGPEFSLISDYLDRANKAGRAFGVGPVSVIEVDDKHGGGPQTQAQLLRSAIPDNSLIVTLDERGKLLSSPDLATKIGAWRDDGIRDLAFVIGGADGIAPELRAQATLSISFGKMVWPHMLARVMLSEQIYRATTIMAGSPYHRI